MTKDALWTGKLGQKTVVYDPTIQLPGCPHLFLWTEADGMGKYLADVIRSKVKRVPDESATATLQALYEAWREATGERWLLEETRFYEEQARGAEERRKAQEARQEAKRLAQLSIEERHAERLKTLGKEFKGVESVTSERRVHRATHCYACKSSLNSAQDLQCKACGWILCDCGACGCGYESPAPT
ncbi:hypothetical protein [Luteibacter sp. dw_328]|uniref:hypothetical protein n=1 Tax=Luteibacter sp. dw_328 TaxID=2719796 RepID=UPI001BD22A3D|nr:hypothetical protein [Luteibacter sp. dw_328]